MTSDFEIFCLIPDLPSPSDVQPFLEEMHSNRWYTNFGPLTRRFEAEMASLLAADTQQSLHTATFSSATTALELILKAMQLPVGGLVAVPALTFPATALAVLNAGLTPVLVDVDAHSWIMSPTRARTVHAERSLAAAIPVASFGCPIDVGGWQQFQSETGVPVVLDAAAALGQQPVVGELITVFSLHATKPFGVGEGGLVTSSNRELLERAQALSNFGFMGPAGVVQQVGTNAKFGEYYAGVGLAQMRRWQDVQKRRQLVQNLYEKHLSPFGDKIVLQQGFRSFIPAVLPVYIDGKRVRLMEAFTKERIQTRHWYLPLLQEHIALAHVETVGPMDVSKRLEDGLLGLPFHAFLSEADIMKVTDVIGNILS